MGFSVELVNDYRSNNVYDPSETTELELDGHKIVTEKEAFSVDVSNTRNELALWGKAPYKKGVGFYGDSNEAKRITWNAR